MFKKATFKIRLNGFNEIEVKGIVKGSFGIYKRSQNPYLRGSKFGYKVTHLNTGLAMCMFPFERLMDAKTFVELIIEESEGVSWDIKDKSELMSAHADSRQRALNRLPTR
jgi:hypothetical protein